MGMRGGWGVRSVLCFFSSRRRHTRFDCDWFRRVLFRSFASRFPGKSSTLWTLVNRNEYEVDGEQIAIQHERDTTYFDVWNGEHLEPRVESNRAQIGRASGRERVEIPVAAGSLERKG